MTLDQLGKILNSFVERIKDWLTKSLEYVSQLQDRLNQILKFCKTKLKKCKNDLKDLIENLIK